VVDQFYTGDFAQILIGVYRGKPTNKQFG
jgi:hypothetical protein